MSDNIDIPIEASGDDGVNRLTSAIDRLDASITELGSNTSLGNLNRQMDAMQSGMTSSLSALTSSIQEMKQVMATGFADISATNQKLIEAMGTRQVRAIEETGTKSAAAWEAAGLKIKAADARTWEQIQRGSAANVTGAFAQMAEGIPVEAVLARYGELATGVAFAMDGSLASLQHYQGEMATATERGADRQIKADQAFATAQAEIEQQRANARAIDFDRETRLESEWVAMLEAAAEKKLQLETVFTRAQAEMEQQREAARIMELDRETKIEAEWVAMLEASNEKKLVLEATFARAQAEIAARRDAQAAAEAERQRVLNTNYTTASPASQVRTATQAQVYGGLGGDASARYGSEAAGADALAAAQRRLAASAAEATVAQARLGATSAEVSATQFELSGALQQAEGAFRGAAHQAGIYGLHHGQLIALLAGGAVAAALHHIAETGAEVEFQLASLSAFSGDMAPVDINKFVGIAAGTMTDLKDAAEGVHALAAAGMTQQQAFRELPDVMRLAALGEMSVAQAAEMAVESMHAFHDSGKSIGEIGDILTAVGTKSNVSIHTLAEDMKSAATTGELFGLRMEEITATVGVLAERGLTIQPLSSALNKLYEPSAKTAKAMEALHLSTKDGAGDLKEYSQFMGELAAKVNQFQVPADVLKQLGMSAQSIKAMQVMTQHLDQYKELLDAADNAQDRMFQAAAAKANSTTGAYEILGSTVQGSMVKAFTAAEPIIRQVEEDLLSIARSQDTQDFLTGLATGFARLTRDIIENRGTIGTLIAGYVGLRVAVPVLEAMAVASTFLFGRVAAVTVAVEAQSVAVAADTVQLELFAVSETAAAVGATELGAAAAVSTTVLEGLGVAARIGLSVLGPMALVIAGVATAFDLFHGKMSDSESDHAKMDTSIESTIGSMDKEIERLRELQKELDKTGRTGAESAYQVQLAFAQVEDSKAKAALDTARDNAKAPRAAAQGDDGTLSLFESNEAAGNLADAEKAYAKVHTQLTKLVEDKTKLAELQSADRVSKDIHKLDERIERVPGDFKGLEAANPKAANGLREQVEALEHVTVTTANYNEVLKQTEALEKAISGGKLRVTPQAAGHPDNTGFRAEIELLQEQHRLKEMDAKSDLADARSKNKRSELGDLALINRELEINRDLHQDALTIAQREYELAEKSGKKIDIARADGHVKSAKKQLDLDDTVAEQATANMWDRMDTAELQHRAKTLEAKGQLEDAFNLEWAAKYSGTLAKLDDDIEKADSVTTALRLMKYKAFLADLEEEGRKSAIFKMDVRQFDADVEHMATKLAELRGRVGPGTGLSTQVGNVFAQKSVLEQAIPQQRADYEKARADAGNDPEKLKQVDSMLKKIQSETAELNNIFVSLGQTIAQSLTDAFGKGGTALGGMVTAAVAYDAELKTIQTTQEQAGNTEAAKAAAAGATADAQIKAYGSMTGAAAGFFDQNSKGYKALHAAEQAFRVFELGMAVASAVKKMTLDTAVTASVVTNTVARSTAVVTGEEGAAAAAVAGAETQVAADQVKGTSAAAVGVATQAQGEPYSAWARMAAMAAVMAGLGFAVSGGGGSSTTAADRQAAQGTGTVLGSSDAKSESIAKAVELSAANSSTQINYLAAMSASLQAIQSNITSFASTLVRTTDVTSPDAGNLNSSNGLGKSVASWGLGGVVLGSLLAKIPVLGGIFDKVGTSIFGGKQSVTDSGITMDAASLGKIASQGVNAKTYADVTTTGGWLRSDKTDVKSSDVSADADRQFAQILLSLGDTVKQASSLLGAAGDDFTSKLNGFVVDIGTVSLKGLSADEIQKQLEAVFSKVGDQMAQAAIPDLQQFQQVGEGYLQTLVRVASDYANVDASLTSIGMAFGAVGIASVAAREDLIALSGGVDKFQSSTASFATNFLTKAQQQAPVLSFVNQQLGAMNLGWVKTREEFAGVVLGLNLTTESGRQTYSSLMALQDAFASTHAAIIDTSKTAQEVADERKDLQDEYDQLTMTSLQLLAKQRDALDESNRALFDQVQLLKDHADATQKNKDTAAAMLADVDSAYSVLSTVVSREKALVQKRVDAETAAVSKLNDIVSASQSALDSMADAVPEDAARNRMLAQGQLQDSLGLLKSGAAPTDDQVTALKSALTTVTKDSTGQFGAREDYMFDQLKTQRQVAQINTLAGGQMSDQKKMLETDKAQLVTLDKILSDAKDQIDILKGIGSSAMSIDEALAVLSEKMATAATNPVVNSTGAITDIYKDVLGRTPDSGGLAYYQNLVAGGTSLSDIKGGISTSAEAQVLKAYQSTLGRQADAGGLQYYVDAMNKGASIDSIIAGLKNSTEYKSHVPGFAGGGDFGGGLRLVGEVGPEVEATGAARIHSTKSLIDAMRTPAAPSMSGDFEQMFEIFTRMEKTLQRTEAAARVTAIAVTDIAKRLKNVTPDGDSVSVSTSNGNKVATTAAA